MRHCCLLGMLAAFVLLKVPAFAADETTSVHGHQSVVKLPQQPSSVPLAEEGSKIGVMWEPDLYYSDVSINIPLTEKPIPIIRSTSESVIYSELIKGSLIPRYMLIEASVYPMPLLGTYLKTDQPQLYGQGRLGHYSTVNVIDSVTAGFQEPWAISAFFGNIAKIVRPGEDRKGSNIGYTGYLFSAGTKQIKDNEMIDDHWLEVEWKIKGKVDYPDEKLNWSFRVGGKFHDNQNITNEIYLNLFRSNLNTHLPFLSWINNSTFDMKVFFSEDSSNLVRQEYIVGKKYPKIGWKYSPTLDVGFIWSSPEEYSGILRTTNTNTLTLVFRPSVDF